MLRPGARKVPKRARTKFIPKPFISPTGGWVTATNLAAAKPGTAQIMENFYPTTTGIRMRGGSGKHGRAATDSPCESLMAYVGAVRKLFGSADGKVFDLTTPADPDVAPSPLVSGQTSDYYCAVNYATPGGFFMLAANGTDDILTFDGTAWATLASGTAPTELNGLASNTVQHLNLYRSRLWMTNGTMTAYYLPTDAFAGTVGEVALTGAFRKGGTLAFSATWSFDAGNGPNEVIVFATTEGEYAIYQGDPVDPTWGVIGVYDASPPLGKNAFLRVGGDLLVLTEIGLVPMSAIKNKDPAALALAAISRDIQPDWMAEVQVRRDLPWEIVKWTSQNIAFVSCPPTGDTTTTPPICFAVNLETGKWAKITGWATRCFALHDDGAYFGTNDGTVMRCEVGGSDDGALIYYTYVGHADHLSAVGQTKTVRQARAVFRAKSAFIPKLSVSTDYDVALPGFPSAALDTSNPGEWDAGEWDQAKWDVGRSLFTAQTYWVSIGATGFAHIPQLQIVSGSVSPPLAELVLFEVLFEPGNYTG